MKRHVMLISTSESRLIDTKAVMAALRGKIIGALKLDMDEQVANLSLKIWLTEHLAQWIQAATDDSPCHLIPRVIATGHQTFFAEDALRDIAETTLDTLDNINGTTNIYGTTITGQHRQDNDFEQGRPCPNEITKPLVSA